MLFRTSVLCLFLSTALFAAEPVQINASWITGKPLMSTYRSTSPQGDGLYQYSVNRADSVIEVYLNIITPGFTKTVAGVMDAALRPLSSTSKIIVNGQIVMDTKCSYDAKGGHISTLMKPYNRVMAADPSSTDRIVDFSQVPLIVRCLDFTVKKEYTFTSMNPQTNTLVPLSLKIVGAEKVKEVECLKIESNDFEGKSFIWLEKGEARRVMKIEQPETKRVTELMQ